MTRGNDIPPLDPLELQRLVDAQLNEDEYRRLLLMLGERPDDWKRCALAFLENQALQQDLSDLEAMEVPSVEPAASAANRLRLFQAPYDDCDQRLAEIRTKASRERKKRMGSSTHFWATLAACCVVALTTGLLVNHFAPGNIPLPSGTNASSPDLPSVAHGTELAINQPGLASAGTIPVTLNDPRWGVPLDVDVPRARSARNGNPPEIVGGSTLFSMIKDYSNKGTTTQHPIQLLQVEDRSGGAYRLPVLQIEVTPKSHAGFQ